MLSNGAWSDNCEDVTDAAPSLVRWIGRTRAVFLAPPGCVWTLAKIAGHANIAMTIRYVHPQADAINRALKKVSEVKRGLRFVLSKKVDSFSSRKRRELKRDKSDK